MKWTFRRLSAAAVLVLPITLFSGCETTNNSGTGYSTYYSGASYDPWYYGGYYDDPDVIALPPGNRPDAPVRPSQPIARPPMGGSGGMGGGGFGGGGMGGGGFGGGGGGSRGGRR